MKYNGGQCELLEQLTFTLEENKLKVVLLTKERQLYYQVEQDGQLLTAAPVVLEGGRRWLRRLEKLHLGTWRASYQPKMPPVVHKLWRLAFKDSKLGQRRIVGDQAYPGTWAAFIDLLNEIPSVEIHKVRQLEQVSLILQDTMVNPGGSIYLPKQGQLTLTEKLIINRGKHILVFTRHKQGLGTERHAFDSIRNVPLLLERIAEHAAEFHIQQDGLTDDFLPQVAAIGGGSFYNYQVAGLVPRWAVGVGVNIKIFDGLNREYKYSAAKQTVRRVGELQNKAGKDIAVLVEKLYNQMMNYRNQMTSIDASLAFAEEYLRMKNAAFLEGMSSSTDLIDAELNLAGVRTERLQAAYNFDLLLAQLLEAAGISDEFSAYARRADARPILFDKK